LTVQYACCGLAAVEGCRRSTARPQAEVHVEQMRRYSICLRTSLPTMLPCSCVSSNY